MPDSYTEVYNLIKPEIGGSIDTWGSKLNQNTDAIEAALLSLVDKIGLFSGMVATFPITGSTPPEGWLLLNGGTHNAADYPNLFARIGRTWGGSEVDGTFKLPDVRGEFIRCADLGRGVDTGRSITSHQGDQNKQHNHGSVTGYDGAHSHGASMGSAGYHGHGVSMGAAGNHTHNYDMAKARDASPTGSLVRFGYATDHEYQYNDRSGAIGYAGNHTHSLSIQGNGAHTHSLSIADVGNHRHTISNDGGSEVRVRNFAFMACIKI